MQIFGPRPWTRQPQQYVPPVASVCKRLSILYNPVLGRDLASNIYPAYSSGIKLASNGSAVGLSFPGTQSTNDAWFGSNHFALAPAAGAVALFRCDDLSTSRIIGAWGANLDVQQCLLISLGSDGGIVSAIYDSGGTVTAWQSAAGLVETGKTHCVAVKIEPQQNAKLWVDGRRYSTSLLFGTNNWTAIVDRPYAALQLGSTQYEASLKGWIGFASADRVGLPDPVYERASRNPWSFFEPMPPQVHGVMVTDVRVYRPSGDVITTGWTATPGPSHWDMLNEVTPDDADYVASPVLNGSAQNEIQQLNGTLPAGKYNIRIRAAVSTGTAVLRVYLLDDSNASQGVSADQTINTTITTYTLPITTTGSATRIKYEVQ